MQVYGKAIRHRMSNSPRLGAADFFGRQSFLLGRAHWRQPVCNLLLATKRHDESPKEKRSAVADFGTMMPKYRLRQTRLASLSSCDFSRLFAALIDCHDEELGSTHGEP